MTFLRFCKIKGLTTIGFMQVEEKDDVWSPETLLTQLASELNSEIEKTEGMAKEGKDAVAAPMA